MKREESVNNFLNSRYFGWIILGITAMLSFGSMTFALGGMPKDSTGSFLYLPYYDLMTEPLSWGINLILITLIGMFTIFLNKSFSFIRTITVIFSSFFILMEGCMPTMSSLLNSATLYCLVTVLCTGILFYTYQRRNMRQSIFLIFCILSACSLFQYGYIPLFIAFFLGLIQMQSLSPKGFIAIALGILAPFWIVLGLGLVDLNDFQLYNGNTIFTALDWNAQKWNLIPTAVTAGIGVLAFSINSIQLYSYKLQTRAYNGFISILMILSLVMIIVDFDSYTTYVGLLNWCVAIQLAHFFTINKFKNSYLLLIFVVLLYLAMYAIRFIL